MVLLINYELTDNRYFIYISDKLVIACFSRTVTAIITNTKKYMQSNWLRGVQYWPYLYSVSISVLFD